MIKNAMKIKQKLYDMCMEYIDDKISELYSSMEEISESASQETKSSMGDKYETGRAILHLEMEKYSIQLSESLKLKEMLSRIDVKKQYTSVEPGCLIQTNTGNYFIAVNAGILETENDQFFSISLASPIGQALHKLIAGGACNFRGKVIEIQYIY